MAIVIAEDDFESYTIGDLSVGNNNGGSGWAGAWSAVPSVTEIVSPAERLVYDVPGAGVVGGGNRAVAISGNSSTALQRTFDVAQTGDIYTAFLIRAEPGTTLESNDFVTVWHGEGTHIGAPAIGLKADLGPGGDDLMARVTGNQEAWAGQMEIGETYYLVGRLSKEGGSTTYNRYDVWVNPLPGDENNPDATSRGNIGYASFDRMGVRSVNLGLNDTILIDNYFIATSWSDITPVLETVPEPAAIPAIIGLVALATAGLARATRRPERLDPAA